MYTTTDFEKTLLKATAMLCITILEVVNLATVGIDGSLFGLVVAAISGLAGYEIGKRQRSPTV